MSIAQCTQHGNVIVIWDDAPNRDTHRSPGCPMCALQDKLEGAQFELDMLKDEIKEAKK